MLRNLFRNIAISAAAFIAVSLAGLILVPILIRSYGLEGFGTISLARLFMPTAALGIFDFGFGETTTQAVARSRCSNEWQSGSRLIALASYSAVCIGSVAGILLIILSIWLPEWLLLKASEQSSMAKILRVTGFSLPFQFLSLVTEGILKGFERFASLRLLEVITALTYTIVVFFVIYSNGSVYSVCYALIAANLLRSIIGIVLARNLLNPYWICPLTLQGEERKWFLKMTQTMAVNKVLGASQTQIAPLVIGLMFGPQGSGTYDALSRLPRAIKSILGLLSSTVLPVAARLERSFDKNGLRRIGQAGVIVVGIIALPPVICAMVFSKTILKLWVGSDLGAMWGWQAAMFLIPGLTVLLSFGGTALLVRPQVVLAMNRWTALQVILQFLLAGLALPWFGELSFIFGQVLAVAITFIPQLKIVCCELCVPPTVLCRLLKIFLGLVFLGVLVIGFQPVLNTWFALISAMMVWLIIAWFISLKLGLLSFQRKKIIIEMRTRFGFYSIT